MSLLIKVFTTQVDALDLNNTSIYLTPGGATSLVMAGTCTNIHLALALWYGCVGAHTDVLTSVCVCLCMYVCLQYSTYVCMHVFIHVFIYECKSCISVFMFL